MICISLSDLTKDEILKQLLTAELFEIRLDLMDLSEEDIRQVFSQPVQLIATCRQGKYNDKQRKQLLIKAIESGASFVDIEIESSQEFKKDIFTIAKKKSCKLIISYHNYKETPTSEELNNIVKECFSNHADISKLACQVNTQQDAARILSLYADHKNLVALGMGTIGKITRLASLKLGAPFSYASPGNGKETAPGQIEINDMKEMLKLLLKK